MTIILKQIKYWILEESFECEIIELNNILNSIIKTASIFFKKFNTQTFLVTRDFWRYLKQLYSYLCKGQVSIYENIFI